MLNGGTSSTATEPSPLQGWQGCQQAACPPQPQHPWDGCPQRAQGICKQQSPVVWGCSGLRHLGTMQREHPACPRSPQLHSPVVVEVEDKVGPWGGRKMGVRAVWSHELAFTLPRVCAVVWGCAGQPDGPGHHCIPLPSTCTPPACSRATPGPENVRHAPHIPAYFIFYFFQPRLPCCHRPPLRLYSRRQHWPLRYHRTMV